MKLIGLSLLSTFKDDMKKYFEVRTKNKQDLLRSGVNVKTVNGKSIVGGGNLVVDTIDEVYVGNEPEGVGINIGCKESDYLAIVPFADEHHNGVITPAYKASLDNVISRTFKTINGRSVLGDGDIKMNGVDSFSVLENQHTNGYAISVGATNEEFQGTIPYATTEKGGVMSKEDKAVLDRAKLFESAELSMNVGATLPLSVVYTWGGRPVNYVTEVKTSQVFMYFHVNGKYARYRCEGYVGNGGVASCTNVYSEEDAPASIKAFFGTALATDSNNGLMSKDDKAKLDGIGGAPVATIWSIKTWITCWVKDNANHSPSTLIFADIAGKKIIEALDLGSSGISLFVDTIQREFGVNINFMASNTMAEIAEYITNELNK